MPVIYDEVFCGLWRLGVESARELLGEDPDVSCYAKLLTGGLVPMAATVATERVFEAFSGAKVGRSAGPLTPSAHMSGVRGVGRSCAVTEVSKSTRSFCCKAAIACLRSCSTGTVVFSLVLHAFLVGQAYLILYLNCFRPISWAFYCTILVY